MIKFLEKIIPCKVAIKTLYWVKRSEEFKAKFDNIRKLADDSYFAEANKKLEEVNAKLLDLYTISPRWFEYEQIKEFTSTQCVVDFLEDLAKENYNQDFNKYMLQVRERLECNATEEYKKENVSYLYSNEQVDANLDYFRRCMREDLPAHLALEYFHYYLEGEFEFNDQ